MNLKNFPKRLDSKTSCLRISVPENLDLALEGLIRKVLREQPKTDDIYSFAANYFETLLQIREKAGAKFTAAQLCPFHNDEDAHEMIKLASTFPKPVKEKFKKRNENSLPSKIKRMGTRKKTDDKIQIKNDVGKSKVKEILNNKPIDFKKQATSDLTEKIPVITNSPEGKKEIQTKSTSRTTPDELEKNEIDDGEFLTSDPIKELVEKELMVAATSTGKNGESLGKTDIGVKSQKSSETKPSEQRAEEKPKPVDQINVQHETHDTSKEDESLAEETKANKEKFAKKEKDEQVSKTQETKDKEETLANAERNEDTEEANEESTAHIKMNDMKKPESTEETNLGKPEEVETSVKEDVKALEKENKEKSSNMKEISLNGFVISKDADKRKTDGAKIISYESTRDIKKNLDILLSKEQPLRREAQLEEKNKKTEEIGKHPGNKEVLVTTETAPTTDTEGLTKIQNDITLKGKGELMFDETLHKDDSINIIKKEKQAPRNVETGSIVSLDVVNDEGQVTIGSRQLEDKADKNEIDQETNTKSLVETEDNFQVKTENKAVETPSHKSVTDGKDDISKIEVDNYQNQKEPEGKMMNDAAVKNERNELKTRKQTLEEANLVSNLESERQDQQQPEICVRIGSIIETLGPSSSQKKEFSENGKDKAPNQDTLIKNEKTPDFQTTKEQEIKIGETKATALEAIKVDENMAKTENTVLNTVFSNRLFRENARELNSSNESHHEVKGENTALTHEADVLISAKPAEIIKPDATVEFKGETKTLTNENQVKTIGETKTVEKVEDFVHIEDKTNSQIEDTQRDEIPSFSQSQSKSTTGIQENGQIVDSNTAEYQSTKENMQQKESEHDLCTVASTHNQAEITINKEKSNELLKSEANGISNKENETQLEEVCSTKDIQHVAKQGESDAQKLEELNSIIQNNERKTKPEELCVAADILDISREDKANKEEFAEVLQPEPETQNNQVKEERQLEKLCTVSDGKNSTNENATYRNKPEEKFKSQEEIIKSIESKIEGFRDVKDSPEIITVEDSEKAKNPEMFTPSEEIQIKTIQTHYYDTLQVPDTVTKEYRVRSVTVPSVTAIEEGIDVNVPSSAENISISSSSEAAENINLEICRTEDHLEDIKTELSSLMDLPDCQEIETDTQKSDSDDLLNLMTPTSGYSLNLSEVSLQTVSGTFLDNEKRYSSLEKEEIRYISPDTSEPKYATDYEKSKENGKQEVEEIIYKTAIPSSVKAVPMPPRDAEEINENRNAQSSECLTDKTEEKNLESESSSPESSNGKSTDSETPFISVEVKTVIETEILDDVDNEDKDGERILRPDVQVTVETTVDFQNEKEIAETASDSIDKEKGISEENTQEKSSLEEDQNKNLEYKQTESCSENKQTAEGREGSSGESDSTVSSAATEIKRTDSAKRNFSPTRSLLSTQSLDLGKRNLLLKTSSLSTFRHGVTDFEVWNTIEKELEEAATKIQSKFRGYKTRKKLQRENAVQITTEESSVSTTPVEAETKDERQQSTGEFHDTIVLSEHPR